MSAPVSPRQSAWGHLMPEVRSLFPGAYADSPFPALCAEAFTAMAAVMPAGDLPRVPGWQGPAGYGEVLARYARLPEGPASDVAALVRDISTDLLAGTTLWRCPELQYNIGAAVNVAAAAAYALALDANVFLISDGQAGNAVLAEHAVAAILAGLAGIPRDQAHGVFTFGGTGTIMYAIKAGIRKAAPESVQSGLPLDVHVMVTRDAHFSHRAAADWLGIGASRVITVPAVARDRRTDVRAAGQILREHLDKGARIAAMLINGGTTYDHVVDDIAAFAGLRDQLVAEYRLSYRPHLHVDSVIGWGWLTLDDGALSGPGLGVPEETVASLREQHRRISQVRLADSWGVDFHKGIGGCPVDCSMVMFSDKADLGLLRKGAADEGSLHQLAAEFSSLSPVDYTLETARAGGKAIAALTALHSMGRAGFQAVLARLVDATRVLRGELAGMPGVTVLNGHSLGFATMVALAPPGMPAGAVQAMLTVPGKDAATAARRCNEYLKAFFAWDNGTRMNVNGGGAVYSYSSGYLPVPSGLVLGALKFYPTSPLITRQHMREAAALLSRRKAEFDASLPG